MFRSVGYKGVALPGLPYDARKGTIPNDTGRIVVTPFEVQQKQLLRDGFAKTQRELDQKLSSDWRRVESAAEPKPKHTVAVVKTEYVPARIRESLRAKYAKDEYRFFSNDNNALKSVIVLAPAEAQEDIEVVIHQLDEPAPFGEKINRLESQDIIVQQTERGLACYSRSLSKWVSLADAADQRLIDRMSIGNEIAVTQTDAKVFAFLSRTGRWATLDIPEKFRGEAFPIVNLTSAHISFGDVTYAISSHSENWTSPDFAERTKPVLADKRVLVRPDSPA